jgi:putative RNA 2'-phosphotransferase
MDEKAKTKISKFLSYALRHRPDDVGIELDAAGWADVSAVLSAAAKRGHAITHEELLEVVRDNDKQRFALSADHTRVRASQGHSIEVDLGYAASEPPEVLYHGTVDRFLASIRVQGLLKGERHHVHLSKDLATAARVGQRRGRPIVLRVRALDMHRAGHPFFVSQNGVWLTDCVPPEYIEVSTQ